MFNSIIVSPDKTKRSEYIQKYCNELSIDRFDITIIEKETAIKQNVNSIGIEEVKNMQKKLFLKPIKSPVKAVILEDAQMLTVQAQNALLKVLEEPPDNTIIILSSETKETFLPTILSRCKVIELEQESQKFTDKEIKDLTEFIEKLPEMPISEKFKKAETLAKDKEKAINWVEKLILLLRQKLLQEATNNSNKETLNSQLSILNSLLPLRTLLKTTNVNLRFAIENTILKL